MERIIILSNIGSASKKYSVYQDDFEIAWFHFEKNGGDFILSHKIKSVFEKKHILEEEYHESIVYIIDCMKKMSIVTDKNQISDIALRIVVPHNNFILDTIYTKEILEQLEKLKEIDPIHITPVLEEIALIQKSFEKNITMYLISDSSFHVSNKKKIPLMFKEPFYTIGYHGLSCESVLSFLKQEGVEYSKLIIAHLGGGSSVTGVKNDVSVYNSMEFSPLDGVVMSSRPGSVDPFSILLYMKENNLSYEQTLEDLYTKSGLIALSNGLSNDLRVIRENAFKGNADAKYAIMQFVDSITAHICKALAYTQGIDTLVFTGTIGYRATYIREMVVEKLLWLGCVMDHAKNVDVGDNCFEISAYNSKVKIYTVQVDEMKEMHKHVQKIFKK